MGRGGVSETVTFAKLGSNVRTYFCIYLFSGSITLMFASPAVVTTADPRGLALPCFHDEWTLKKDATNWLEPRSVFYTDAMIALWSGKPYHCSPFGERILATSVFLEIWQAQRGHGPWLPEDWKEKHYTVLERLRNHIENETKVTPLT